VSLAGSVLVVTGGSRGIGRSIVLGAVARGARVIFCSRSLGDESEAVERAAGGAALAVEAHVTREADVERLFDRAVARYGPVDAVVNNAAVSRAGLLTATTTPTWDEVVSTNLTGVFLMTRQAIRHFLRRDGGQIVSIGTLSQFGARGNTSYAASKGGAAGLMRMVARQYGGRGIRANLVIPGYVETQLSAELSDADKRVLVDACPLRRPGSPDEIAGAVLFCAGRESGRLNGNAVYATGGMLEVPL